ncbi:unnamed protein product [Caenorhabditis nigoni]
MISVWDQWYKCIGPEALDPKTNKMCLGASEEVMACLRQERSRVENPSQTIVNVVAENPAYLHCSVPPDAEHEEILKDLGTS